MKRIVLLSMSLAAAVAVIAVAGRVGYASDHDDGETDLKARALNLSDHFAFKSPGDPTQMSMIMYFNPRSLPGKQYFMSTKARYEFHVSKVATRTTKPTGKDDYLFRFEAAAPDATGAQNVTLTVFKDGAMIGTSAGKTTTIGAPAIVTNTGKAGAIDLKWFIGPRADSFAFDVVRFFQVRSFLASRFFGGAGGNGNAAATLANNCRGDAFLNNLATTPAPDTDDDKINLFNPPSCAPDFTKNLNVTAIVLNIPIAQLDDTQIFDTWSTISVAE